MKLEPHLQRQLSWIGAADHKVPSIFAIDTAMLGVLAASVPQRAEWTVGAAIAASLAALPLIVSVGLTVAATFPRVSGPKGSLLYFGGICEYDEDDFIATITTIDDASLERDFGRQIYRTAQIAKAKYWFVRAAMISMFAAVVPWSAALYLLY